MNIEFNRSEILKLIRFDYKNKNCCVSCNPKFREVNETRCKPCYFTISATDRKTDPNHFKTGVGLSNKFHKFGVSELWGKSQLFYFLYHPELNNEYPQPDSIIDIFGKEIKGPLYWVMHHMDKCNYNDNIWNQIVCLRHEHGFFETMYNEFNDNVKNIYKRMNFLS